MTAQAAMSATILSIITGCISLFKNAEMNPTDWAKSITDFGITVVIAGLFLYIVFRLVNLWIKYLDGKISNKKHDKLLDLRSEIGEEVQDLLEDFVTQHNGDRVQVIEFSNTVMSIAYLPFKYMTCTYEVCSFGTPSKGQIIDHMSTSLFTHFFKALRENPHCVVDVNSKDVMIGGAMYDLMKSLGQDTLLCTMLTTSTGKAIGYISFQKPSKYTNKDISDFEKLSKQVTTLLGVMDN